MIRHSVFAAAAGLLTLSFPGIGQAQESPSAADLARQATDPTASLMAINFIGNYVGDYRDIEPGEEDDSSELTFRPVIPFTAFDQNHILRLTVPYHTGGRGAHGLGTVSIFDLIIKSRSWGRLGFGGVAALAREGSAPDELAIGPAVGFVRPLNDKFSIGVFSQNVFASDTAVSQLQPVITYQLGGGWSLSAGDAQWIYDWKGDGWIAQPIGVQLGKVTSFAGQAVRWAVNPQYDIVDHRGSERWSLTFTFTILAPGG